MKKKSEISVDINKIEKLYAALDNLERDLNDRDKKIRQLHQSKFES